MSRDYTGLIPEATYDCGCGECALPSKELFYYEDNGSVYVTGEGFYCKMCIKEREENRFEEIFAGRKAMLRNLLTQGWDLSSALNVIDRIPLSGEEVLPGVCLADVIAGKP